MKESSQLEFKESVSNTFLKTVSAFANYGGGTILFGVDDSGHSVGIPDRIRRASTSKTVLTTASRPTLTTL